MSASAEARPGEQPGDLIDRYELLEEIGEGGMGVVWKAAQEQPVQRTVALKVIKLGMDTRDVVARFEAERQALALMDHPHIAKVLDGGATASGRPYFVMELVNGVPITEYCEGGRVGVAGRLELFAQVCDAIQHAHHKGIIHRDIKPTNVMVAREDSGPTPRVIDFGIAKAVDSELTQKTLLTRHAQMIGTPDYMAPEQAELSSVDVDTRADVYSLGVLLYELLTGRKPFDAAAALEKGYSELLRSIREDVPQRPSTRVGLARRLPSDLDWVVMRALEKDRSRRYETAAGLAADVRRYLQGEPVQAAPPSVSYRLRKFAGRNPRVLIASAIALFGFVIAGAIYGSSVRAERGRLELRSTRLAEALDAATLAYGKAASAPISEDAGWIEASAAMRRVADLAAAGPVDSGVEARRRALHAEYSVAAKRRELELWLENTLISNASHADLQSWQRMEREMVGILRRDYGIDLDSDEPMDVARRIREHAFAETLAAVFELWISTRAFMSTYGGPVASPKVLAPWTEAIYAADPDPLRTGIRRIIYERRQPSLAELQALTAGIDLEALPARTVSWLSTIHIMAGFPEQADALVRGAIHRNPRDPMLAFDRGFALATHDQHQEAIRMFTRAAVLRPRAAGIWRTMATSLLAVDEVENARFALEEACALEDHAPSFVELGGVLLRLDLPAEAESAARRALDLAPEDPAALGVLGRALLAREQPEAALPVLERCHRLGSRDPGWGEPSGTWLDACRAALEGR